MYMHRKWGLAAAAAAAALVLAACGGSGGSSESSSSAGGGGGEGDCPGADAFCIGLVTDTGKVDDKSFNQSAKEGMDSAADELGIKPLEFESANDNDYAPNLETAVSEGCSVCSFFLRRSIEQVS